jgi:hypothetical protein
MIRQGIALSAICLVGLGVPRISKADGNAPEPPDVCEVYGVIRAHLPGANKEELNRTAVQALVAAFSPRVLLITNGGPAAVPSSTGVLAKSSLFDGDIAYLRVPRVEKGLSKSIQDCLEKLGATNKLRGIVMDFRYASGTDYAAATAVADLFTKKERPLLNWGAGVVSSKEKNQSITIPVAVLVNRQTAGAPEALAGMLRLLGAGLILGDQTAGQALIPEDYPLANGDRLQIGIAPVVLGDGTAFPPGGLKPDIAVAVSAQDERTYYADAYKIIPKARTAGRGGIGPVAGTNLTRRPRINEAELVRERREGYSDDSELLGPGVVEPDQPLVRDPALARALDLLKGLAVVREARS